MAEAGTVVALPISEPPPEVFMLPTSAGATTTTKIFKKTSSENLSLVECVS